MCSKDIYILIGVVIGNNQLKKLTHHKKNRTQKALVVICDPNRSNNVRLFTSRVRQGVYVGGRESDAYFDPLHQF